MANIVLSEEELTVEVGHLDVIVVSTVDETTIATTDTHDGKGLDELTAESTGTNHEKIDLLEILLNLATVNANLVVIATTLGLAVNLSTRKTLEDIVMQPLVKRSVLASLLDELLSDDTTEESSEGRDRALRERGALLDNLVLELGLKLSGSNPLLGELNASVGISGSGVSVVGGNELEYGGKTNMELVGAAKLTEIGGVEEAKLSAGNGVREGLLPGVVRDFLGHLLVLDGTLTLVVRELGRIELKRKRVRLGADNLGRRQIVDLGHALNLGEHNIVTLLIGMALVLVHLNGRPLALLNEGDDELSGVLTVVVRDDVLLTVVKEGDTESTGRHVENVAAVVLSAELVEGVRIAELAIEKNLSLADDVRGGISSRGLELIERKGGDLNVRVELSELLNASLGSTDLADMRLLKIEVGTEILNSHEIRIADLH